MTKTDINGRGDEEEERTFPMLRNFRLFDAAQVEGQTSPPETTTAAVEPVARARRFVHNLGARIDFGDAGASYVPATGHAQRATDLDFSLGVLE